MDLLRSQRNLENFHCEYTEKILSAEDHFEELYKVCNYSFVKPWGSYLFNGQEYRYDIDTFEKQKLLYEVSKKQTSILEIGVYMGHSLLIMLLANPKLRVTCIDIDSTYSGPATNYLKKIFSEASINFICSDSLKALPTIKEKFDMFHIDGAHKNKIITQEFEYCLNLTSRNEFNIILDDVEKCEKLEKSIKENFNILEYHKPGCKWTNSYLKILKK